MSVYCTGKSGNVYMKYSQSILNLVRDHFTPLHVRHLVSETFVRWVGHLVVEIFGSEIFVR